MSIECKSRIERVTVYARGAQVTRSIALPPELTVPSPGGQLDLTLPGVTSLSEAGSFAASAEGGSWKVLSVKATLSTPSARLRAGELAEATRGLEEARRRLEAEQRQLLSERSLLLSAGLGPRLRSGRGAAGIGPRTAGALGRSALIDRLAAEADERLLSLDEQLADSARAIEAARLRAEQATGDERRSEGQRSRCVVLRIGGEGRLERLELHYVVPAARWWPVYALRMRDGGDSAALSLEALVAQVSGEDWADVRLLLASADRIHDARLPELASLRLGRAQARPASGFRPPPPGLDKLFAGHDRAFSPPPPSPLSRPAAAASRGSLASDAGANESSFDSLEAYEDAETLLDAAPMKKQGSAMLSLPSGGRAEDARLGAPAPGAAPMAMASAPPMARSRGGGGAPPTATKMMAPLGYGAAARLEGAPPGEDLRAIEPSDAWLDLGGLELGPSTDRAARGRLRRVAADDASGGERAMGMLLAAAPGGVRDLEGSRGHWAHRYETEGPASVPSDGLAHRVTVGTREGRPRVVFRTVPRETPEVFREAVLDNPFAAPLLAGPVDVYLDGSLVAVAEIERVGRGGLIRVGLGVEERVRAARNVVSAEGSSGLLGGSTTMTETVKIELRSSLGRSAEVEVIERLPVTDDKNLTIEPLSASPDPVRYDQSERGEPLRGGLRWVLPLAAGGKSEAVLSYRITFPSRSEIVGGNRRG